MLPDYPPPIRRALKLLEEGGERAWLVGGAARDLLLGRAVKDYDFVIEGDGLAWARRLAAALGGAFVALDEERKVGRVVVREEGKLLWLDVASFRGAPGSGLEEDLRLRDFTVNAIALDPDGGIIDPTGGALDLEVQQLRLASPRALTDDPLRVLRAVRLRATHGLAIPEPTLDAMREAAPGLARVAMERVREEWLRLLAPAGAAERVALLGEVGALAPFLPELVACMGVAQSPPHSHDVYGHQLLVLTALEPMLAWATGAEAPEGVGWAAPLTPFREGLAAHLDEELASELPRWLLLKHVALLHDMGKPPTRSIGKEGRIHFYEHERVGGDMVRPLMRRLRFPSRAAESMERIVRAHMRPLHLSSRLPPSPRAIYRFFRDAREEGIEVALHAIADQRGKLLADDREEVVAVAAALLDAAFNQRERYLSVRPLLDGSEIIALTGREGRAVGEMLEFLREQQAQGRVASRDDAERALREWSPRRPRPARRRRA